MKKWVLIILMLLLTLPGYALITIEKKPGTGTLSGHLDDINANDLELDGKIADKVSDDAFTVDWAEVTDVAPSQAALYNYLVNFDADGDGLFSDEAWFPTIFDPAAPGEIGGTTPSTATFTELTVGIITSTPVDGENRLTFIDNTARSPAAGAEEIYSEGGLMKYSENGIEKSFVTIDDTAGDGDTTVTLSADKIAEYIAGVSVAAPTIQVADPTLADTTGWYLAKTSGDLFYVNHGIEMFAIAGTRTADETAPVIGDVTPSALTHDGTGATLTATVASVTEPYELNREWSLYDVTDDAVEIDWAVFTGLSITGIAIPSDQHTYRIDVRCTDLAGNVGTASSAGIIYGSGSLISEGWEGTGLGSWTSSNGSGVCTIDSDYTTTPLEGSQSLYLSTPDYNTAYVQLSFTDTADYSLSFNYISSATPSNNSSFITLLNSTTALSVIQRRTNGTYSVVDGSATVYTTATETLDTEYKVWIDRIKGTGSNGQLRFYFAPGHNPSKPGTASGTVTTGTSTLDANALRIGISYATNIKIDSILLQ